MKNTPIKIGVTGCAGSGKSLVCKRFSQLGLKVVSCDGIARQVVEPGTKAHGQLVAMFGKSMLGDDGGLDRKKLRALISGSPADRERLEGVVQPAIVAEMLRLLGEPGGELVVAEVPLLFELDLDRHFDVTMVVAAPRETLIQRISVRDGVDFDSAGSLLDMQMSQEEKIDRADHVLWNTGSVDSLCSRVDELFGIIRNSLLDMG
ncbi:MAG: dephospho-CoA kinase [Desulfobacteraceae bacterium]|nr:dephospho-CoA kinase [Desulfobacteraceae bacterium]